MSTSLSVLLKEPLEIRNFEIRSHLYEYFMSLLCTCTRLVCVNVLYQLVPTEPREEPLNNVQNLQIFMETDLTKPQVTIVLCRQQCIYLYISISPDIWEN